MSLPLGNFGIAATIVSPELLMPTDYRYSGTHGQPVRNLVSQWLYHHRHFRVWGEALQAKLSLECHEVLELGMDGGNNLSHLTNDFQATAVDSDCL
jgi:hypothetical protein